jgi:hypothetical protein
LFRLTLFFIQITFLCTEPNGPAAKLIFRRLRDAVEGHFRRHLRASTFVARKNEDLASPDRPNFHDRRYGGACVYLVLSGTIKFYMPTAAAAAAAAILYGVA